MYSPWASLKMFFLRSMIFRVPFYGKQITVSVFLSPMGEVSGKVTGIFTGKLHSSRDFWASFHFSLLALGKEKGSSFQQEPVYTVLSFWRVIMQPQKASPGPSKVVEMVASSREETWQLWISNYLISNYSISRTLRNREGVIFTKTLNYLDLPSPWLLLCISPLKFWSRLR